MRPDDHDLDDEIRGHLAISVKERIDQGEDPEAARLAALRELGYVPAIRDSMRRVWHTRWLDAAAALGEDLRIGVRSLRRAKGLSLTVIATLALGIGANAAIFSVVREVLLRPLVNRDQDRLIYIRQSAPGLGVANTMFSIPEIDDFRSGATTISAFGDFSTIDFTMIGFGEPRVVQGGVVGGAYFDVMGLRPVLGRLIDASDDGPDAAGAVVLTHRFWSGELKSDPTVVGPDHPARHSHRHGRRRARAVGAVPGRDRDHRQRREQPASPGRDDGDLTHASDDGAVRAPRPWRLDRRGEGRAERAARRRRARAPRGVPGGGGRAGERHRAARPDRRAGAADAAVAARRGGRGVRHRVLERREPDSGAVRATRKRAGRARRAGRQRRCAAADAACREPAALWRRRGAWRGAGASARGGRRPLRLALLRARARRDGGRHAALGGRRPGDCGGRGTGLRPAPAVDAARRARAESGIGSRPAPTAVFGRSP